jgi:hypothetical protein
MLKEGSNDLPLHPARRMPVGPSQACIARDDVRNLVAKIEI